MSSVSDNVVIIVKSSPGAWVQWSEPNIEIIIQLPIYATKVELTLNWKRVLWAINDFAELKINAVIEVMFSQRL